MGRAVQWSSQGKAMTQGGRDVSDVWFKTRRQRWSSLRLRGTLLTRLAFPCWTAPCHFMQCSEEAVYVTLHQRRLVHFLIRSHAVFMVSLPEPNQSKSHFQLFFSPSQLNHIWISDLCQALESFPFETKNLLLCTCHWMCFNPLTVNWGALSCSRDLWQSKPHWDVAQCDW